MARRTPSLRRAKPTKAPATRFTVFCEGRNTEPAYLNALQRVFDRTLVEIRAEGGVGGPATITEKAIAHAQEIGVGKKRKKDSFTENDQVWAMFDRDEHPKYQVSVDLCISKGVGVARSDPCFELWLILHIEMYDKPSGRHDVQRHLERIHSPYKADQAKNADCKSLISKSEVAEGHALAQYDRRRAEQGRALNPPYTTVFELTKALKKAEDERQGNIGKPSVKRHEPDKLPK